MLLAVKRARIQAVADAKEREADIREHLFEELADWVGEQLGHVGGDGNGRLADLEEAVDKGDGDGEEDANDPGADRRARHLRVIVVADDGAHLGVRRVVGDEGRLNLHLGNQLLVLFRVVKHILVV